MTNRLGKPSQLGRIHSYPTGIATILAAMTAANEAPILILVRDLLFQSRITSAAKAANQPFEVLRDPNLLAQKPARLLIADLNQPGVIPAVGAWIATTGGRAVGFVSHVDTDVISQARAAGIQQILARGAFVAQLPSIICAPTA